MDHVLQVVREHLGNPRLRVPSPLDAWSFDGDELRVQLDGKRLGQDIQSSGPSIPSYLIALAYWYEQATGDRLCPVVEVIGEPPDTPAGNRGRFMLTELGTVLGDRLTVLGLDPWQLPDDPVMNAPLQQREASHDRGGPEHQAEVLLTRMPTPMGRLQRQFPLGLFAGSKSTKNRLFPGNGAQADLWGHDPETRTFHLVELKVGDNAAVGILPESLTYARLLQRFAAHPSARWSQDWEGSRALLASEKVVVWLVGERYHPLVFNGVDGPWRWFNEGPCRHELEFRVQGIRVADHGVEWSPPR